MIGYSPGDGWLHRVHPFAVLGLSVAVALAAIAAPDPWGPGGVLAVVLLVLVSARLPAALGTSLLLSVPFWFFLLVIHGWLGGEVARAAVLASRLTAIIAGFTAFVAAVHPARMTEALVEAGAPFSVAYLFSATLQAVPRLRARAVDPGGAAVPGPRSQWFGRAALPKPRAPHRAARADGPRGSR